MSDRYATILTEQEDNKRIRYIANRHIFQNFKPGDVSNPYFLSNIVGLNENNNTMTITNGWVGIGVTNQTGNNLFQVDNSFFNTIFSINNNGVGINTAVPSDGDFSFSVFGSSYYGGDVGIGTTIATERLRVEGNVQAYIFKARGADYAEWEILSENCKKPASGTVVGFNKEGKVTDKFSDSIHFGVVSLNPSIIGNEDILNHNYECIPVVYMGKINMILPENCDIGDYLVPIEKEDNAIGLNIIHPKYIHFPEYIRSIGYIHRKIDKSTYEIIIRM
jgi:hypothetical protein